MYQMLENIMNHRNLQMVKVMVQTTKQDIVVQVIMKNKEKNGRRDAILDLTLKEIRQQKVKHSLMDQTIIL
jgi:hypothetical protein